MRKLLFFHAPWCPPCRFYQKQFIDPLMAMVHGDQIVLVNAQDEPFLADKYLVTRLPTVVLLDHGTVINRITGAIDIKEISKFLEGCD